MDRAQIDALQRDERRRREDFEKTLRSMNRAPDFSSAARGSPAFAGLPKASKARWSAGFGAAPYQAKAHWQTVKAGWQRVTIWPWRPIAYAAASLCVLAAGLVASQIWVGYRTHSPEAWAQRLQERRGSPIFSSDGQLHGTLYPAQATAGGLNFSDYGYVPTQGELPPRWVAFVTTLEQQTLFNPWRSVCGIDPLGIVKRVVTLRGGGSGLAEQNAKNLSAPEMRRSEGPVERVLDKFQSWGLACSLHEAMGGDRAMVRLYADYAPVAQINGTLRGVEAGAWVLFNRAPADLPPHQLAVLAALVQRPLALASPEAFAPGCDALRAQPHDSLPDHQQRARQQCVVFARARVALERTLSGEELTTELAGLEALESTGLRPANPFAPLPTWKLVNLSERTKVALGAALLQHVADEAERVQAKPGEPLVLTMAQPEQMAFARSVRVALRAIDESLPGRETLCVPLSENTPLRSCPGTPDEGARADVVLARMTVDNGRLQRLFESSRLAFGTNESVGSIGKMVIALAAVVAGLGPDTRVCPRQVRDGARLLRRLTSPEHGYQRCTPAQHISLADMMARSDNLAAYELARKLGPQALRQAALALGLVLDDTPGTNLAYQLAFGTQAGTPEQLLQLGQALFGVAYDVPVRHAGPRVLVGGQEPPLAYQRVLAMLPQAASRQALRVLLEAPVSRPSGTLHHLRGRLAAGKTGTTSAPMAPQPGARPYVQAKYTLAYVPADRSVMLSIIAAPAGHALALHHLRGQALEPAIGALLAPVRPASPGVAAPLPAASRSPSVQVALGGRLGRR